MRGKKMQATKTRRGAGGGTAVAAQIPFDGSDGELLPLRVFAKRVGVHYRTAYGWCLYARPALPFIWRNGWRYTTMKAYYRWLEAQNQGESR